MESQEGPESDGVPDGSASGDLDESNELEVKLGAGNDALGRALNSTNSWAQAAKLDATLRSLIDQTWKGVDAAGLSRQLFENLDMNRGGWPLGNFASTKDVLESLRHLSPPPGNLKITGLLDQYRAFERQLQSAECARLREPNAVVPH
jgi:hypothetical protein